MSSFRYGFQTWMQYSSCGLTSDLENICILSLSMVSVSFLVLSIPTIELTFVDASAHFLGLEYFALLSIITSKPLSFSLTFNTLPCPRILFSFQGPSLVQIEERRSAM